MVAMTGGVADRMSAGPSFRRKDWPGSLLGSPMWLRWVLATAVGWAAGGYLGSAAGWGLSGGIILLGYGAGLAAGGLAAGALQWIVLSYSWPAMSAYRGSMNQGRSNRALVLQRQAAWAGWWMLASSAGAALLAVLMAVLGATVGFGARMIDGVEDPTAATTAGDWGLLVALGLFGTVLGALQWLVLRRRVPRAGWWVLASAVGWPASMGIGGGLATAVAAATNVNLSWVLIGAVYGAITGTALLWLLRQSPTTDEQT